MSYSKAYSVIDQEAKRRFTLPRYSSSSTDIAASWTSPIPQSFSRHPSGSISNGNSGTWSSTSDRFSSDESATALYNVDLTRQHDTRGSRHLSLSVNSSSTSLCHFDDSTCFTRSSHGLQPTLSSPPSSEPSTTRIMHNPTIFEEEIHYGHLSYAIPGMDVDGQPEQNQADEMATMILEHVNRTSGSTHNRDLWWI
ncbi:hypothetical protein LIPSTDRAFT_7209 [Lipomyces starkeyi NRRL Y-11557]|uniref:Uncharacterized protein n=1 Tax=Lipomyces starkeyi NRRL Y-11557 TaxID=675824 RepID=A0A1E3PUT9_LIPST|nr:hypothetical protein LIPSTDRAFT_7209 [Lipomyces starkeyi NRRL Y-11557]